jgi:hypothetical protein
LKTKNLSYVVIVLLLVGSFTTLGLGKQAAANEQTFNLQFTEPKTSQATIGTSTFSQISMGGIDNTLYVAGEPVLPMYVTTLEFPLGTTVASIDFIPQGIKTMTLPTKIQPAPQAVTQDVENPVAQYIADESIYGSAQYFPDNWFDYSTGGGLNSQGDHTTFVNIRTFPVRYNPGTDTVQYIESAVVKVNTNAPVKPMTFGSGNALIIITPQIFKSEMTKLVTDKTRLGLSTTLVTLEDIYANYTKGYDKPENIKLFIKNAVENMSAKYVLLVGGYKGYLTGNGGKDDANEGVKNWYFPVRYTNLDEGGTEHDPGYVSDLYYADIYNANGSFSSWDSNHDHIYAKWSGIVGKDIIDLYPDVYVSRIACRTAKELNTIVNKIITYESAPADPSWYKRIVLVGGDSFDDRPYGLNVPEGEYSTSYVYNESMRSAGFIATKLYASNKNLSLNDLTPTPTNIKREVTTGCGFLYFDGHGNPLSWNTHWLDMFVWARGQTPGGLNNYQMFAFRNGNKLNVCIVGGCHNSMINISLLWSLTPRSNPKSSYTWVYGQPTLSSWSETMMAVKKGGSIACIGNTGLGYGLVGEQDGLPACIAGLGGYVERTFFKTFNESANKTFGGAWAGAITKYLQKWPGMAQQADCKTVEEWLPLGDPSLVIGG